MRNFFLKYARFSGRASLHEYRRTMFAFFISVFVVPVVLKIFVPPIVPIVIFYGSIIFWIIPVLSVTTRRFHDLGKDYEIGTVSNVFGLLFEESQKGNNRYGDEPKK